jgi:hypothetical protein
MDIGMSRAIIAASLRGVPWLGWVGTAACSCSRRTGSSNGSFCTFSSDSSRYRPGSTTNNQAWRSLPVIQVRRSQKCLGRVTRLSIGRGPWTTCGSLGISRLLPIFPQTMILTLSCIYSMIATFQLTFPQIASQYTPNWISPWRCTISSMPFSGNIANKKRIYSVEGSLRGCEI